MFCVKCQHDLIDCDCLDLKERLERIGQSPNIASRRCKEFNHHYAICDCKDPEWVIKVGGTQESEEQS